MDDDIFNHILSEPSLKAFLYEYTAEGILQRKQEGSASASQAASLGKDTARADGETMIGEACTDNCTAMLVEIEIRVCAAANQSVPS